MGDPDRGRGWVSEWAFDEEVRRRWRRRGADGPPPEPPEQRRPGRFFAFPAWVVQQLPAFSPAAVVTLLAVLALPPAHHDLDTLCRATGLSRKTVVRALDELEERWVISVRVYDRRTGQRWYEYIGT